jgi:hypothetical protein
MVATPAQQVVVVLEIIHCGGFSEATPPVKHEPWISPQGFRHQRLRETCNATQ